MGIKKTRQIPIIITRLRVTLIARTTEKLNTFISPTMLAFGATSYAIIAISVLSLLIQSKGGWLGAIAHSVVWPVYIAMIIGVWSLIGEMLTESVGDLGEWKEESESDGSLLILRLGRWTMPYITATGRGPR